MRLSFDISRPKRAHSLYIVQAKPYSAAFSICVRLSHKDIFYKRVFECPKVKKYNVSTFGINNNSINMPSNYKLLGN